MYIITFRKGGIIMTDNINKNIDNEAIDLEKLDEVSGGATMVDPGVFYKKRFVFDYDDVIRLKEIGIDVQADVLYLISELNDKGIPGSSGKAVAEWLERKGIRVNGK